MAGHTSSHTHYEVLGVDRDATNDKIRAAYRAKLDFYLDLSEQPDHILQRLEDAFEVLGNEDRNKAYNRKLQFEHVARQAEELAKEIESMQRDILGKVKEIAKKHK